MHRAYIVLILLTLAVTGCEGMGVIRDLPADRFPTEREFNAPFDTVWQATLDVVFDSFHIKAIDKSAGFLSTSKVIAKSDYIYEANLFSDEKKFLPVRYSFNIRVERRGEKVVVKTKLFEEVELAENVGTMDDPSYTYEWEPVQSSTARENALLRAVAEKLGDLTMMPDRLKEFLKEVDKYIERKDYKNAGLYLLLKIEALDKDDPLREKLREKLKEVEALSGKSGKE